ncbi:TetR/AcrR family transcriptional regulator [Nocardia flavorosea]|uniref:TetR/AcrR family transcriptional regulator n=1 Tax=Nocardia flavorosea TaxID=53429 RepID=UPI0007A4F1EF|nr:TetR/AcrR family transcriptional regulator [Nocardia flavorosea]
MTHCVRCGAELRQPSRGRRRQYCSRSCQARAYRARQTAAPARVRPAPRRLSAVVITRAAVELADRTGLDGLTMRRLAGELGVATAALYRHFDDREQLLAAMVELVLDAPSPPPGELSGWRARLRHEAQREWQLYRRHPWVLPVLARVRPPLGPGLLDTLERTMSAFGELDLPRAELMSAYLSYSALVQGLALLWASERTDRLGGPDDTAVDPPGLADLIDATARPTLYRVFDPQAWPPPELDFDALLSYGVDMLLDGVAVRQRTVTE